MERRRAFFLACVLVVSLAFLGHPLGSFAAKKKAKAEDVVITGKVMKGDVVDEDTKFYVIQIRTADQGDYEVINKGKGRELRRMLDKKVEATGAVKERKGKKYINVSSFKIIE